MGTGLAVKSPTAGLTDEMEIGLTDEMEIRPQAAPSLPGGNPSGKLTPLNLSSFLFNGEIYRTYLGTGEGSVSPVPH